MSEPVFISSRARSCRNCARAKAKCYGVTNSKCERCGRLNKDCTMQIITRRPKPTKITRSAQIAQLEEKLDGLVNILTKPNIPGSALDEVGINAANSLAGLSQAAGSTASPDDETGFFDVSVVRPSESMEAPSVEASNQLPAARAAPCAYFKDIFFQPVTLNNPPLAGHTCSNETPEELLEIFRKHLARQVPFIAITSDKTATELQEETPHLWKAIVVAASYKNASHQIALGHVMLKDLADAFLVRGEKTLDLLQGILVFLSWYQYQFHINMQLNNLLGLVNALFVDLGLNKPSLSNGKHEAFANELKRTFRRGTIVPKYGLDRCGSKTIEERRLILGCFYLSSCVTSLMPASYIDAIRSVPYMEESCHVLEDDGVQPNDQFLAQLTRIQFLVEKMRLSGMWDIAFSKEVNSSRAPISMYVQTFGTEFENFICVLPSNLREDKSLLLHYHIAAMHLYEIGFYMPLTTSDLYHRDSKFRRLDVLNLCLLATKTYLDLFLSISPRSYFSLSLVHCSQIMYAISVLSKLSLFKADDWDQQTVRNIVDLASIENRVIARMEEASATFENNEENGVWSISARRLRKLQKLSFDKGNDQVVMETPGQNVDSIFALDSFDLFDDSFWQGVSGDAWQVVD